MREILRWLLFSAGVIVATAAQAEVMDKEPSILAHWLSAVVLGGGAIAAWRWRWWAGSLVTAIGVLIVPSFYWELNDSSVGPAIRAEAGNTYVLHYYLSASAWVLLNGYAIYAWTAKRRGAALAP